MVAERWKTAQSEILIVDETSQENELTHFAIRDALPNGVISKMTATALLQEKPALEKFEFIFLSSDLALARQCEILLELRALAPQAKFIPVSESFERDGALRLLASGADSLLALPASREAFWEGLNRAEKNLANRGAEGALMKEEVSSLPWVLETVAGRLENLAVLLRERGPKNKDIRVSTMLVEELMLSILAAGSTIDDAYVEKLLSILTTKQ